MADADVRELPSTLGLMAKDVFDFTFSLVALILLSPVILCVGLLVKFTSKGPILYSQERVGLFGKRFRIYKFRTMVENADQMLEELAGLNERGGPAFKIDRDPRCTSVGYYLRKYCLDELPQLFNILNGDMSLVGPRPPLPEEVRQYKRWQLGRLEAKPGLTCYWQISNRNMTFDEWVESDLRYIKNRTFLLDLWLIVKTLPAFIFGHK